MSFFLLMEFSKFFLLQGDDDRPMRGGRNDFSRDGGRSSSGRVRFL